MSPSDARTLGEALVELRGIERSFGRGEARVEALRGVDLDLRSGEYVAIRGPSGSGKSTLLQIIGLLDTPTAGTYRYRGQPVEHLSDRQRARFRNEELGFVFQAFHLLKDRTALENVQLPLAYRRRGVPAHEPREMLARVGLSQRVGHRPGQLSGGEQQRVAIARALVKRPKLVIFDEPTGNLDQRTGTEMLELLDRIHQEEGTTFLLVTHDPATAARAARSLVMVDGCWEGRVS
ncbi:MAG: ABC transporter ATP-binding protein [Planctomycetota bacterium]